MANLKEIRGRIATVKNTRKITSAMSRIAARRRAAIGALGDLEHEQKEILRARWFALKIRGVDGVLERLLP